MKAVYKQFMLYILVLAILVSFCGCNAQEPPNITNVEEVFTACYDDIQVLTEYLISIEYVAVTIDYRYVFGEISVKDGSKYKEIKLDPKMQDVVSRLMEGDYECIFKSENTIEFCQWRSFNDIGCGIAYSINGIDKPEIQYLTELTPLGQDGWYYYVSDFNAWRVT